LSLAACVKYKVVPSIQGQDQGLDASTPRTRILAKGLTSLPDPGGAAAGTLPPRNLSHNRFI